MKRVLVAALIAASMATPAHAAADYTKWRGPCDGRVNGEEDTAATPVGVVQWHTKHLVRCVFDLLNPTWTDKALYVADRESHFFPDAYNPSGCAGVFQHMESMWTARTLMMPRTWLSPYLWTRWRYGDGPVTASPFNPYVNVIVTAVMTSGGDWGPWGG